MVLIEEFEKGGCRVEFVERPMSSEPNDQLLLQIRGAVAGYERTLLAERMRRGRLAKYKAGLLLPRTHVPYGLRVDSDRPRDPAGVSLDEAKAAVIAETFEAYLGEVIPLAEYQRRRQDLERRNESLASREKQLQAHSRQRMELAGVAGSIEDFCERVHSGLAEATF